MLKGLPVRVVASKNALISGYYQHRVGQATLDLIEQMQNDGLSLDASPLLIGIESHNEIMSKRLLLLKTILSLVDMYAICGKLKKAQKTVNDLSV